MSTTTIDRTTTYDLAQYSRLSRRRDAALAARRAASDDSQHFRSEVMRLESLERNNRDRGVPKGTELAVQDRQLLERARAGLVSARAHVEELASETESIGQLVPRLTDFLIERRVDLALLPPPAALPRPRGAVPTIEDLEQSRHQIVETRAERERIAAAPASEAESFAAIDAWLDSAAAGLDHLVVDRLVAGDSREFRLFQILPDNSHVTRSFDLAIISALLVETARPAMRKTLRALVAARAESRGGWGLDAGARAKRLQELEREVFAAELEEERALRTMESAGLQPPRRAEADPRAVLAEISRS